MKLPVLSILLFNFTRLTALFTPVFDPLIAEVSVKNCCIKVHLICHVPDCLALLWWMGV